MNYIYIFALRKHSRTIQNLDDSSTFWSKSALYALPHHHHKHIRDTKADDQPSLLCIMPTPA